MESCENNYPNSNYYSSLFIGFDLDYNGTFCYDHLLYQENRMLELNQEKECENNSTEQKDVFTLALILVLFQLVLLALAVTASCFFINYLPF